MRWESWTIKRGVIGVMTHDMEGVMVTVVIFYKIVLINIRGYIKEKWALHLEHRHRLGQHRKPA
jgi:hypothetical protein